MDSLDTVKLKTLPATSVPAVRPAAVPHGKKLPFAGNNVPAADKSAPAPVKKIDLSSIAKQLETYLSNSQRSLNFRVDDVSGRPVITVINPENGEIIRQIPSEEALRVAASITAGNTALIDALA